MDADRFDTLARFFVASGSRRRALGGLLAGSLGLLGVVPPNDAAAKNCKKIKAKKKRKKCLVKRTATCASCTGDEVCQDGACVVPACGAGGPCLVFLSSILYSGNLKGTAASGLAGADAKCQDLAMAAGLPGTYKAWLSDSTSSVSSRFVPSTGPYRLVNGTTVAANWADLVDGTLAAPITVTETGGGVGAEDGAWTHTLKNGNAGGNLDVHCRNWSRTIAPSPDLPDEMGDFGRVTDTNSVWTLRGSRLCGHLAHLYCFQQR